MFDENDEPVSFELVLGRAYRDEVLLIPLRESVMRLLKMYREVCNFTYMKNSDNYLFGSRKGNEPIRAQSVYKIIKDAASAMCFKPNIGGESLRKTYFMGIYEIAENKIEALVFAERLMGASRYTNLVKYLGLPESAVDMDYYFGDDFSLGSVDFERVESALLPSSHNRSLNLNATQCQRAWQDKVSEQVLAARHSSAEKLLAAGGHSAAMAAFKQLGKYRDSANRVEEADSERKLSLARMHVSSRNYANALEVLGTLPHSTKESEALFDVIYNSRATELFCFGRVGDAINDIEKIKCRSSEIVSIEAEIRAFLEKYSKWLGKWCFSYASKKIRGEWLFGEDRYSFWIKVVYREELELLLEYRKSQNSEVLSCGLIEENGDSLVFAGCGSSAGVRFSLTYVEDDILEEKEAGKLHPSLLYRANHQGY